MAVISYTQDTLGDFLRFLYGDDWRTVAATINRWLARGDGAAVYTSHDLGSSAVGEVKIVSYGSNAAQLETGEPPATLPDIGSVNWRYQLTGTYRGEPARL